MNRFNLFAQLAKFVHKQGSNVFGGIPRASLTRKQLKKFRPPRYKPAFSMGFRGATKSSTPIGTLPAPTIDQVRNHERKYGQRIHVKNGLMFFAFDGLMWTKDEAERRLEKSLRSIC
jgi:hypothetical protein